jgi:hypothetical protein
MQRIPNPVSDLSIFIRVFIDVYNVLHGCSEFGLDDISRAMVATNNVTSQGALGIEALTRSTRVDRSRDPIYNQSKMYAELFRTLGWIQSTSSKLKYSFSLLGDHVVSAQNPKQLMIECLLGIAYPNEVLGVRSEQTVRVIGGILLTMDALGSISRDEMMAGPMSISNDKDENLVLAMLNKVKEARENKGMLDDIIDKIAISRGITRHPTMENYTRFPVAAIPWAGWGVKYGRSQIHITEEGKAMSAILKAGYDFRVSDFYELPDSIKPSFIRCSFYRMLERSGFLIDPVREIITVDELRLTEFGIDCSRVIFFSPFQQLSRETIEKFVPELVAPIESNSERQAESLVEEMGGGVLRLLSEKLLKYETTSQRIDHYDNLQELYSRIADAISTAENQDEAVDKLYKHYRTSNKETFYPLVSNLFRILSYECRVSRMGQNYERADAIIIDDSNSIPIEIKSPGEENEISVKGVRQALENKIVLLSRKNYPTTWETTTLVVGYNPPNVRSEVHELIADIKNTYGISVGVIDFKSLLSLVLTVIVSGKKIVIHDFNHIEGVFRV